MSDAPNPGADDRPQGPGGGDRPGRSLWDQVPDAEPWQPSSGQRPGAPWSQEPTRAVPPASSTVGHSSGAGSGMRDDGEAPGGGSVRVMENLVGSRIERARAAATASGWDLSVRAVDPEGRNQPDGMVVGQAPRPGTPMRPGSAVAVSVVSRRSFAARNPGAMAGLAALAALVLGVLAGWAVAGAVGDDPAAVAPGPDPQAQAQLAELTAANQELTAQVETLQADNGALQARVAELEAAAGQAQAQVQELTAERDQAVADLAAAQEVITTLEESLAAVDDTFATTESLVGTQLSAAQAYAQNRELELRVAETSTLPEGVSAAAPGTVLAQAPQPGVPVAPGSVIWVEVYVEGDEADG